ncbi:MAG: hypothetical protein GYB31_09485 [Bacteroidetes bacterium]|nr:hypothetical protein [Bacteroidota bacterium]
MEKSPFLILISLLCVQCTVNRSTSFLSTEEQIIVEQFSKLPQTNQVQISPADEPGSRLWLCLTFIDKESREPIADRSVYFYHTSAQGEYDPVDPSDESTARLNGAAVTDSLGRIFVNTILPGDYGTRGDNRHIHTTVEDARPEAYDIHFKQYTRGMGKSFIRGSDQHFLADLKYMLDSTLITFLQIETKR